ncbi:HEAT repeat domain-containing protein [Actinoplanes oblitus]|uniref:HEAT repeat domain-containing protein n=1 Tax=Actinoplanes oblitus TaxID=3040509 RepID=A0ABY8WTY1_9ACTN|nr:HEAT repeat domain-containing protein [Actinoplanes oblitus]WIN00288.1 HEAT repeat domain-containing protein [Actinoplanes oblitus]
MSDLPAREEVPLEVLLRLARREVEDDYGDSPRPALAALHLRATREVFDRAAVLVRDNDSTQRELGVQILRELGGERPDGRRPFHDETVALMRARLRDETDPAVVRWIVSALGYHRCHEALPQVVALAGHPDERVRFHVAAALPSLVDLDRVEPEAAGALIRLCHDEDDETRFYALYAVTREIAGLEVQAVTELTAQLADDPDEQIRAMAAAHHEAIHEVRELLTEAFEPGDTTGSYDHLIGPVLVTLACAGDADDAPLRLDDEIHRHLATAADRLDTSSLAARLVTWWADKEQRRWS